MASKSIFKIGRTARAVFAALLAIIFVCALVGCSENTDSNTNKKTNGESTTDQMFSEFEKDATIYIFGFEGKALSVEDCEQVDIQAEIIDGGFYKVVADIEYLNGGVAGYYRHPVIKTLHNIKEVSPDDLNIQELRPDVNYGLSRIGDYGDGDILLYDSSKGVWRDVNWVYSYKDVMYLNNGREILVRDKKEVTPEIVERGLAESITSCPDYFAMPTVEDSQL